MTTLLPVSTICVQITFLIPMLYSLNIFCPFVLFSYGFLITLFFSTQVSSNKHHTDKSNNFRNSSTNNYNQADVVVVNLKQASHNFRKNKYGNTYCDCQQNHHQNCLKCSKNSERNLVVNNNNFTNLNNNMGGGNNPNMLSVSRVNSRGKLRQQSSSLGSFESSSNSPCLSRGKYLLIA